MTETEREQARLERNRYYREYRAKNKERIREITERCWAKKAKQNEAAKKEED